MTVHLFDGECGIRPVHGAPSALESGAQPGVLVIRLSMLCNSWMARRKKKEISEELREVILAADKSRYRIAKETGLTEAGLSRFVNGVSGLSLDSIDKIGEFLDLEIGKKRPEKRKGK